MLHATHRVAEGARWALSDRLDDLLGRLTVGVDPWFLFQLEHRGEVVGTESCMGADTPVIMNGDLLPGVIDSFVQRPIGQFLVRKLILAVSAVTKWFVTRAATTTQGNTGNRGAGFPIGLLDIRDYFRREII